MESQNYDKSQTAKKEEEVLKYWRDNKIFEKTLEKESPKGEFVFHDGPPFATGLPHYGSLLPSVVKDLIPRYKTMQGYHVRRRWGWDCHGLPIESMIEKQLGLKSKKDIESIGVEKFNNECRGGVLACADQWQDYIDRAGRWVNFSNSYKTMDNEYMESVWWALGEINKKGLLYEGRKVLMYCPRCETPLAKAEIAMDNSYKEVTDQALTVKFKLKPNQKIGNSVTDDNTYILAWTTTPWTLPSNVALAVGEDIVYVKTKSNLILAKDRVGEGEEIGGEFSGSDLLGLEYESLFDVPAIGNGGKKAYYIISGEFVTTQDGTGVVHIAPIYGEDDYNVGAINDLPMVPLLDQSGHFTDKAPSFLTGQYFKKGNKIVAEELRGKGMIFKEENYTHSYPHCYRCGTALIYNALSSWFINIQKIKKNLIDSNEDINWIPDHLKHGRFLNILENAPDWNISRNRYWASPLPIWKCGECSEIEMISSVQDIKNKTRSSNKYFVVRHGEAGNNINSIVSSRFENSADYPLTEKGKEQAASAAKLLKKEKIDIIIHSDFDRTKNTAEIIAQELGISGENMIADKRLWEAQFGEFEGKKDIEYHTYFQDQEEKFYKNPPGGENLNELKKRVGDFLYEVDKKYNGKNILFVTHDYTTWLMFAAASGLNERQSVALREEADGRGFIKNGEVKEFEFAPIPHDPNHALNLHRPYIDEITFGCAKCDGRMKRVSEVLDCWFESGAMPFAEYHYPFENKKEFEERAERALKESFISEYIAQTRTWFYYMHAVTYLVFGKRGFKNVITTGNILAQDGSKISKSKGNYTDPMENLDKYGADALRYYLMTSVVMQAEDIKFSDQEVKEAHAKIINILRNTFSFFELYKKDYDNKTDFKDSENVLDKWILIRLDELVKEVTDNLESFNIVKAGRPIAGFVDDLSTWYLRRSRERFKSEDGEDKQMALATMKFILLQLAKAIAPFMPFIAEEIYRGAGGEKESVHLEDWPTCAEAVASPTEIIDSMEEVRKVASLGLEARAKVSIKVRQPLASLKVKSEKLKAKEEFLDLIKDELNVKEVVFDGNISGEVELDTEITLELKEEGELREFLRALQDMRKKAGLTPEQKIVLQIETDESGKKFLEKFSGEIGRAVGAEKVEFIQDQSDALEVKLEDKAFKVKIG